ncbi:flagellin [Alteribacter populi]|uniref:flagellin N-terminal helical domain-containing protein n=1 Tax=Alteribacter populi TaxID=2011011 RepID=UPI000BBADE0C|nr:flagellin [Alteribacter populi]
MIINNNIPALNTHRQMGVNQQANQNSMEKLSSGMRINRAGDDAAGLAISEKMRAQINGLDQASRNSQDGISLIQTAEGALDETHSILQRMRELSVQSANDTNTNEDRDEIQKEIDQLSAEIDRIGNNTEFNTKTLVSGDLGIETDFTSDNVSFATDVKASGNVTEQDYGITQQLTFDDESAADEADGVFEEVTFAITDEEGTAVGDVTFTAAEIEEGTLTKSVTGSNGEVFEVSVDASILEEEGDGAAAASTADTVGVEDNSLKFHIGANDGQNISVDLSDMRSEALGVHNLDVTDQEGADAAIATLDSAIESVSAERSKLGAVQNRLEHTISNLDNASENLSAAESRIRDVDMAAEMMEMTRSNILSQASQSMLAQANQQPQSVLQLLG